MGSCDQREQLVPTAAAEVPAHAPTALEAKLERLRLLRAKRASLEGKPKTQKARAGAAAVAPLGPAAPAKLERLRLLRVKRASLEGKLKTQMARAGAAAVAPLGPATPARETSEDHTGSGLDPEAGGGDTPGHVPSGISRSTGMDLGPDGCSSTTEIALSNFNNVKYWLPLSVMEDTTEREISPPSLQPLRRPPIGLGTGTTRNRTGSGGETSEDHTGSGLDPEAGGVDTPHQDDVDGHAAHARCLRTGRFVNRVTGCGVIGCCGIRGETVGRDAGGIPFRVIHV